MLQAPEFDEVSISSVTDLVDWAVRIQPCANIVYRGHENAAWPLVPSLARLKRYQEASNKDRIELEEQILSKTYASRIPLQPEYNERLLAAITAQHHGAPTRLLDWTRSPLAAAYFATSGKCRADGEFAPANADAAIFAAHVCDNFDSAERETLNKFKEAPPFIPIDIGSMLLDPPISTLRVSAQQAVFTISYDPMTSLEKHASNTITHIYKIVIPMQYIKEFRRSLFRLGIRKFALYPDQDGANTTIAAELNFRDELENLCRLG